MFECNNLWIPISILIYIISIIIFSINVIDPRRKITSIFGILFSTLIFFGYLSTEYQIVKKKSKPEYKIIYNMPNLSLEDTITKSVTDN